MNTPTTLKPALSQAEIDDGRANWQRMTPDMREFFIALVDIGLADGRRSLARVRVAVLPEVLPPTQGVKPAITTREEREAIERIRTRGARK